jgi:hypothetical protein
LQVFAKLFEDRLERGLEAQVFFWSEIRGDDDVLDFFVGHLVRWMETRIFDGYLAKVSISVAGVFVTTLRSRHNCSPFGLSDR